MMYCACVAPVAPKAHACAAAGKCAVLVDRTFAGRTQMKSGIFEIDGVEDPDADASDPIALGGMQGPPPPQAKLIRFQEYRFLESPQIRWTLSHMREVAPTAAVWRGGAPPSDLGQAPHGLE